MGKKEVKHKIYPPVVVLVLIFVIFLAWLGVQIKKNSNIATSETKQPDSKELMKQANQFYESGNYIESIRQYGEVVKMEPKNYGANIYLGHSYRQLGIYDEALKVFEKTKTLGYVDYRTYYGLGLAYYNMEDYNNAFINMKQAFELNPNDKSVVSYMINIYNSVGMYDEAINLTQNKLKNDGNNSHYYRKLAIAYFLKNDLPKALENAEKAATIYNSYAGNDLTLGTVYLSLNKKENALGEFKAALILPQHTAYEGLAITYKLLGEEENSKENLKLSEFYPKHSNSLSLLGFALLDIKEYEEAINEFNLAISNTPGYYLPYKGLGKVYLQLGQKEKAKEYLQKASELNSFDKEVKNLLEQLNKA